MELFKLFGTIAINNSEANKAIDDTSDKAVESHSKISGAFEKIGKAATTMGKVVATGLAAGATAIGKLTKDAVSSYADYEQLVGGVETLFKDSSSKVIEYANQAYKTAGLSANDYMETVTGFSASLLQSLSGDTDAASDKANQALVDMSDNANKMGTSMESIKNAYQGFAKQNYTMLDNLKLGYGGTKEEMERLLEDAQSISGVEYDISSFADIVDAIHVVQTTMGITGTTSEEAATTISGSLGMMKGAWANLLTGMSDSSQNIDLLLNNFVDSVITVVGNIAPRLIETVPRLVTGLVQLIEELLPYIAPLIEKLLPELLNGAARLVVYLIENLPSLIVSLGSALFDALKLMFSELGGLLSPEAESSFGIISNVFQNIWDLCVGIWQTIGQPLVDGITQAVSDIAEWISTHADEINEKIDFVFGLISDAFSLCWDVCQTLWQTIGQPIFDLIVDCVKILQEWFEENFGDIETIVGDAFAGISEFWEEHLKPCFEAIGTFLDEKLKPVFEFVFKEIILPIVKDVFDGISGFWNDVLKPVFTGIIDFLTGVFSGDWEKAFNAISNILETVFNAMIDLVRNPVNTIIGFINGLVSGVVSGVNKVIESLNSLSFTVPNWVPVIGGESFGFDLSTLTAPQISYLAEGGVIDQPTLMGYNPITNRGIVAGEAGAEAVVPLEQNKAWISKVAEDMNAASGNNETLEKILSVLQEILQTLPETLVDAITSGTRFEVNNREFARLVKAVN